MMGAGKSTAGAMAASSLEVPFFDTDVEIARRLGCSVAQLWGELGEKAFRDMEKAVIAGLADAVAVVSTGGGAPLDEDNRSKMSASGRCVWLRAHPNVLAARVGDSGGRPLLAGRAPTAEILGDLLSERSAWYSSLADHQIETDGMTAEEVAAAITTWWSG